MKEKINLIEAQKAVYEAAFALFKKKLEIGEAVSISETLCLLKMGHFISKKGKIHKSKLKKKNEMPTNGSICVFKLNDNVYTAAKAVEVTIDKTKIEKLIQSDKDAIKAAELQYQENLKVLINKSERYAILNAMSSDIYQSNLKRGFDASKNNIGQTLMLIVSELSEALEADRKNKHAELKLFEQDVANTPNFEDAPDPSIALFEEYIKDSFEDEIADSIIRLLDLCGALKIDIDKHIKYKRNYNESRPFLHGKQY